jgi:carboxymethylenebutenolidase
MISQDVIIPANGSNMPAHLARPEEGSGPHPAVIVLQDIFGFTPETKRVTQLLASIGYVGLAINYFHRTSPQMAEPYTEEGVKNAEAIAATVTAGNFIADVRSAVEWLNAQPFVRKGKIATWGFGFGANAAFITSNLRELSGAILFYPTHVARPLPSGGDAPIDRVDEVAVPLLIMFGVQDYYIPACDMDRIAQRLKSAGKLARVQIYANVGHSFFRHGRPQAIMELRSYSDEAVAQAVADAWNMVKKFLIDVFSRSPRHAAETGDIRTARTPSIRA